MKMLRVYRIFTYFGKLGKRWSEGVLFAGVLAIVGVNITFLTLWIEFGGSNGINHKRLLTPEDSFHYYEIIQDCTPPSIIASALYDGELLLLNSVVVLLAILTRNIQRQYFKDTKKVNIFIYLDILISYTLLPLAHVISDDRIRVYLMFASVNSTAILCQIFLFLPKCLPPLLRNLKLKYLKTTPKNKQNTIYHWSIGNNRNEDNTLIAPMLLTQ